MLSERGCPIGRCPLVQVLFVCTGNICRSPTAEGVFRALVGREGLVDRVGADSAGTHHYHVGEPPDQRSAAAAAKRGVAIDGLRARQARAGDFDVFDMVVAMDRSHHVELARLCPPGREGRLHLFMHFAPDYAVEDVPDPYYGGSGGFERVLDMIEAGCKGVLEHIRRTML